MTPSFRENHYRACLLYFEIDNPATEGIYISAQGP